MRALPKLKVNLQKFKKYVLSTFYLFYANYTPFLCFSQTLRYSRHVKPEDSVSNLDPPTEPRLYVGALIPKDKTMASQTPLQINTKIT